MTDKHLARALLNAASTSQLEWALERARPQPLVPLGEPVSLGRDTPGSRQRVYIYCLRDHTVPLALQRRMVAENPCGATYEIDTDHCASISRPNSVARILTTVAESF